MITFNITIIVILFIIAIIIIGFSIKKVKCKTCGANKKAVYAPNYKTRHLEYAGHYCPVCDKELIHEIELGL